MSCTRQAHPSVIESLAASIVLASTTSVQGYAAVKNVFLVSGGFVDGAGWKGVYNLLKKNGYTVSIVQNPTLSLADDVAAARTKADGKARRLNRHRRHAFAH